MDLKEITKFVTDALHDTDKVVASHVESDGHIVFTTEDGNHFEIIIEQF